ncbi:MAG: hypothetical protein COA79_05250 [Planctomycetota bacterium]|nr:MAG: hypothetical protein COA79_05250 [Planctomycetota bacterium]
MLSPNSNEGDDIPEDLFGYEVKGFLGEGGMNKVYKIKDTSFDRLLALKVSKKGTPSSLVRFMLEGKITGQLQHPVVPPVYTLSSKADECHYTMKRIRGTTLKDVLAARLSKDPTICSMYSRRRLITIFISLCQAISYAHSKGVIHRDIKPENIMLGEYGEIYLIDWGLAKAFGHNLYSPDLEISEENTMPDDEGVLPDSVGMEETIANSMIFDNDESISLDAPTLLSDKSEVQLSSREQESKSKKVEHDQTIISNIDSEINLTQHGAIFGTYMYMAPEQARGDVEMHDHRTDLYSLGLVLWEILVVSQMRETLMEGTNKLSLIQKIGSGWRPELDSITAGLRLEPDLKDILLKATNHLQDERYQTGADIELDLQKFLDGKRKWKLVHEEDFSNRADQDESPDGWVVHSGSWGIRDGFLAPLFDGDTIIHLDKNILGDVKVEIEALVVSDCIGEISPILAAPKKPKNSWFDDGYIFEFGANDMSHSKIAKDGLDIAFVPGIAPVSGKEHLVVAELLEGRVRLEIDGEVLINQRDLFPLKGDRVGFYSYTEGIRIKKIRVFSSGTPREIGYLAVPDVLMKKKLYEDALSEYKRYIESHPGSEQADEALYKSIHCLLELKRYPEAIPLIEKLKRSPMSPLACVANSLLFEKQFKDPIKEAKLLVSGLKHTSKNLECWEDLKLRIMETANKFWKTHEVEAAHILFEALFKTQWLGIPIRANAANELCSQLIVLGQFDKCILLAKQALNVLGHFVYGPRLILLAGEAYSNKGQFKLARTYFKRCLDEYPENKYECSLAGNKFATSFYAEGNYSEAQKHYEIYLETFSNNADACVMNLDGWAGTLLIEGEHDKAKECYIKVSKDYVSRKNKQLSYIGQGFVAIHVRKFKEAQRAFDKVIALSNGFSEISKKAMALTWKGDAYLQAGSYVDARRSYNRGQQLILADHIDQASLLRKIAITYRMEGLAVEEESCLQKILDNYKDHKGFCVYSLYRQGRLLSSNEEAIKKLKFTKKNPKTPFTSSSRFEQLWEKLYLKHTSQDHNIKDLLSGGSTLLNFDDYWWAMCFMGNPGRWLKDEQKIKITPAEALRRTPLLSKRPDFQEMLDFCAYLNPSWKKYASGSNGLLTYIEMQEHYEQMPKD